MIGSSQKVNKPPAGRRPAADVGALSHVEEVLCGMMRFCFVDVCFFSAENASLASVRDVTWRCVIGVVLRGRKVPLINRRIMRLLVACMDELLTEVTFNIQFSRNHKKLRLQEKISGFTAG